MSTLVAGNTTGTDTEYLYNAFTQFGWSQSFTGNGATLDYCTFSLEKILTDSTIRAYIYAHTGTFGTSSKPTGSPLASSAAINVSALDGSSKVSTQFTFSGADRIALANGTNYCVTVEIPAASTAWVYVNSSHSNVCPGNAAYGDGAGAWTSISSYDLTFEVYGTPAGGGLFRPSVLAGLGSGGPFFQNPLGYCKDVLRSSDILGRRLARNHG